MKNIFKNEQKVGMLLQKRTDTRGVGISSMRKSIYLLTTTPIDFPPSPTSHTHLLLTTPTSHTHTFHPLSTIVIHTLNFAQVQSMDDNCGEWVECMGVVSRRGVWLMREGGIYGCGCKEVYRFPHTTYISLLLLYLFFFAAASLLFVH